MSDMNSLEEKIELLEKRVTQLENIINGSVKGKAGRKNKFNIAQQNEIIQKHSQGLSYSTLAKEYNASKSTIGKICKGKQNDMIVPVIRKKDSRARFQTE